MIRERFSGDLKQAVQARHGARVAALGLICAAIKDRGARPIRDLAEVMAQLKARHSGRMDVARACLTVKQAFG